MAARRKSGLSILRKHKKYVVRAPIHFERYFEPLEKRRILSASPVGYWHFDQNGNDSSGNSNTATLVNSPSYGTGHLGSAISLNGSSQYLTVADNASFNYSNGLTIATWVKINSAPSTAGGIWSDIDTGSQYNGVRVLVLSDRTIQFRLGNATTYYTLVSSTALSTGAWHQVTCTFDGTSSTAGTMKIYIDGVQETGTTATSNFGVTDNSDVKYIGQTIGQSYYLNGSLDELQVYNQALMASDVHALSVNPVGYWQFEQNGNDSSGNANNATAVGSPTYSTGKVGSYGVSLNGTSQYLTVANSSTFDYTNGVTVAAWLKVNSVSSSPYSDGIWWDIDDAGTNGVRVLILPDRTIQFLIANSTTYYTLASTTQLSLGTWHQVACTFDGTSSTAGTLRIYIDGVQESVTTTTSNVGITNHSGTKIIGKRNDEAHYLNAAVDDMRVYNQALSAWDVDALVADRSVPFATITSPVPGGSSLSGVVTISATATDNVGVASVQFQVDNIVIGTDTTAPYTCNWDTTGYSNGAHVLSVIATDTAGNSYISNSLKYASYAKPTGDTMITSLGSNAIYSSVDNGTTWSWTSVTPDYDYYAVHTQGYRRDRLPMYVDPVNGYVIQLVNSMDVASSGSEPANGDLDYYLRYRVSIDGGASYLFDSPVVQSGMTQANPFSGINIGDNAFYIGDGSTGDVFRTSSGKIIIPAQASTLDGNGDLTPYYETMLIVGTWQSDHTISWSTAHFLQGNPSATTRGLFEPTITQLSNGTLLCVMRGSNGGASDPNDQLSSYKWYSISTDDGTTWSTPAAWTYSDSTNFFSPSSCSRLVTTSSGDTYWIGNIIPTNSQDNSPRYPLVIAKVDPTTHGLIKSSVLTIDTLQASDTAGVNLSHMWAFQDRKTGDIVVTGDRYIGDYSASSPVQYMIDVSGSSPTLVSSPFVSVSNITPSPGLVARWSLNNSASDSSGYGNTATLVGSPSYVTGKLANAVSLNGSSQSLTVADNASFNYANGITVSTWMKIAALPGGTGGIWSDIDASAGYRNGVSVAIGYDGLIYFIIADASGYSIINSGATSLSADGLWHQLTCTYDNAYMKIYIDGNLITNTAATRTITDNSSTKYIGDLLYYSGHNYFNGSIDDLQVYTHALSSNEVGEMYKGPVGYWSMNEGTGSTAIDTSGYGNNATAVGSPTWVPGTIGPAISLNGSSQSLTVADNASFNYANGITVSTWMKIAALPGGTGGIWSDIDASAGYRNGVSVAIGYDGLIYFIIADASGYSIINSGATSLSADGLWHQLTCTYDNAYMKIYIDGNLITNTAATRTITDNSSTKYIGDLLYYSGHNYFNGSIDDLQVYTHALSSNEVVSRAEQGQVASWSFDDGSGTTVRDSGLSSNNATLIGSPSWVTGRVGSNALSLNGSSQYVTVNDNASFDYTRGISVSTWLKVTALPSSGNTAGIWSDINGDNTNGVGVYLDSSGHLVFSASGNTLTSSSTLSTGTWYHVACTFDGNGTNLGTMRLYINGVAEPGTTITANFSIRDNSVTKWIGRWIGGGYLNGTIDDMRVYNRALSANEVESQAVGPVASWSFDDADGPSGLAMDSSTFSNTAALVNNPSYVTGQVGTNAVSLNGSNQYLTVADNASFNYSKGLTVATWIKINSAPSTAGGIWSDIDTGSQYNGVQIIVLSNRTIQFRLGNATTYYTLASSTALSTGTWHQVTCTFDGTSSTAGTMKIYIDGVQETGTTSTSNFGVTENSDVKYIGQTIGQSYYLNGALDDLKIYTRPLSASEVKAVGRGAVAHWTVDEGKGTQANDTSGYENNATAVGNPTWVPGKIGPAISLNGTSQYLTVNDSSSLNYTNGATVSMWIKIGALPSTEAGLWSDCDTSLKNGIDVSLSSAGKIIFRVGDASAYTALDSGSTSLTVNDAWRQITCTYDNAFMRIYVDGTQVNSVACTRSVTDNSATKLIGEVISGANHYYFNGSIDDLKIYDYDPPPMLDGASPSANSSVRSSINTEVPNVLSGDKRKGLTFLENLWAPGLLNANNQKGETALRLSSFLPLSDRAASFINDNRSLSNGVELLSSDHLGSTIRDSLRESEVEHDGLTDEVLSVGDDFDSNWYGHCLLNG